MGEPSTRFFDDLASRGQHLLPGKYGGTIRFDLTGREHSEHWLLSIDRGNVAVSREMAEADCVMHANPDLFDQLVTGRQSWMPMLFRGEFVVEGDLHLLTAFRKLLPGPPGAHHPREAVRTRRSPT